MPTLIVDIDGVLFDTIRDSVAAFNREHGTDYKTEDIFDHDTFHNKDRFVVDGVDYFFKHQLDHESHRLIDGVIDALRSLKSAGVRVTALTARSEEMFYEATMAPMQKYFGVGSGPEDLLYEVYFSKPKGSDVRRDKGEIIKELNGDMLIDDSVRHCRSAAEYGIPSVLLGFDYNKDGHDWPAEFRAEDWPEAVQIILNTLDLHQNRQ